MNDAVFISDLHLHPKRPEITQRFKNFLAWAEGSTKAIYILGDFFHIWLGDDCMDEFARDIAILLKQLKQKGMELYWMPGNRDFLIGNDFLEMAGLQRLEDPSVILLPGLRVMLSHGDAYCVFDRAHQLLRLLTRNIWFCGLFQLLPQSWRLALGASLRSYSQMQKKKLDKSHQKFQIGQKKLFATMSKLGVFQVIYGHVHRSEIKTNKWKAYQFYEYVLSDWDASPKIICYNIDKGLHFLDNKGF
jgi:UDP-2,3-diacylglucosamine hydrolase